MGKVTIDLPAFDKLTGDAAAAGLRGALGEYERILKGDVLNRSGSGRVYGKHQASAPGEPPAPDFGNLRANTNADPDLKDDGQTVTGRVVANSAQASALHNGTERIPARPFMDVPARNNQADLQRAFTEGAKR